MKIKSTLAVLKNVQDTFERNGKVVDAELRAAFPPPPLLSQLTAEPTALVDRCLALETDAGNATSAELKSGSPFVEMAIVHRPARRGERDIAIGIAQAIMDCPPLDAASWFFTYCSRDRMRINNEQGHPAKLMWRDYSPHDKVFASVKKGTVFVRNREFVCRQIIVVDDRDQSLLVASESVDDIVDYGTTIKAVRGFSRAFVRVTPISASQCSVAFFQFLDFGGRIPAWVVMMRFSKHLQVISESREQFERDDEIDLEERNALALSISNEMQDCSADESARIQRISDALGGIDEKDFVQLDSPDFRVSMGLHFKPGDSSGFMRASVVLDTSIEECAAEKLCQATRSKIKGHYESGNLDRSLTEINEHSAVFHAVYNFPVPGFLPREFVLLQLWKKVDEKTIVVVSESTDLPEKFPVNPKYVRATTTIFWRFERLPTLNGVNQTRATLIQQVDFKGAVPKFAVNSGAIGQLKPVITTRKAFDKSQEIDAVVRGRNVRMIEHHATPYSEEENGMIESGIGLLALFKVNKVKEVKAQSPTVKNKIAFKTGDVHAVGCSETTVRATKEQILSYFLDTAARCRWSDLDMERSVIETKNDHHTVSYQCKKGSHGGKLKLLPREGVSAALWRKEVDGLLVYVAIPTEHHLKPEKPNEIVRAIMPVAASIEEISPGVCKLVYVNQLDMGGGVPVWVMNFYLKMNLTLTCKIQTFFQALRRLEQWNEEDGRAVGEIMVVKTKAEQHREKGETKVDARMRELFKRDRGLKEIGDKYGEFFQSMMARVVLNKLRTAGDMNTKLFDLNKKKGDAIGAGLAVSLVSNLTAEAAVEEWIGRYPALKCLDRDEIWFRPMMNVVAVRLLANVSWGLKMRVFVGAGLSILDQTSDINMIFYYFGNDQDVYGVCMLGMIVACITLQVLIVYGQNRKKGPLKLLREVVIVLTGLKPAFDAFRINSGAKIEKGSLFDPQFELIITKYSEILTESIPGCILQIYALLKSKDRPTRAIVSIMISAATTGMASAVNSFDTDVDPKKRKETPNFYGYVPDGISRTVIFACMVLNSALLLMMRSTSAALLMMADKRYFFWYLASDMGLYLFYKIARGDFLYQFPLDGAFGLCVSLFMRAGPKVVTDFTGYIHARHPYEMGGAYWTFNMFLALMSPFAAVYVYFRITEEEPVVEEGAMWNLVSALGGAWVATFCLFLKSMKAKYRKTFFSLETGSDITVSYFESMDDAVKSKVFTKNKILWTEIAPDAKAWLQEGWETWEEEQPAWFTEVWKSRVPDDMIPEDVGGGLGRKSSLGKAKVSASVVPTSEGGE
jgi:hypothetical protein